MEYGLRLKYQFPSLRKEIDLIIKAFNQEVYGEIILNDQQWTEAESAWRKLRSPLHWPLRLKTWFFEPTYLPEAIQYDTSERNLIA